MSKFLEYGGPANLQHINPKFYVPEATNHYEINCVSCAIATDVSLSGILVSAMPYAVMEDTKLIEEFYGREFRNILEPQDIHGKNQSTVTEILAMKMNEIRYDLTISGEKSRLIIYVKTIDPGGHVFNAWNKRGVIEFLDGQNNRLVERFGLSIGIISLLQTGLTN